MPEAPLDGRNAASTRVAIVEPPLRAGRGKPSASSQEVEPFQPLAGWLGGAGGIGGLLARSTHATSSPYAVNGSAFYHADGNGKITYLLKSDGSAYANYKYDPYGRTLSSAGTLASANLLRFSSKPVVLSATSGLGCYYGYRFYDPNTQRWINRDPVHENGGINLNGFVGNGPTCGVDRHGLYPLSYYNPLLIFDEEVLAQMLHDWAVGDGSPAPDPDSNQALREGEGVGAQMLKMRTATNCQGERRWRALELSS